MTTPYIDPNLIFAENAPVQDKPAAFSNYDKGWDESRKNDGRPLIPQMNYLAQQADLKNLYIHENGAALPFDENMEYAENAVVVKDGVLQQWKGGELVALNSADQIVDASGVTQQEINDARVVVMDSIADLLALPAEQRKEGLRYLVTDSGPASFFRFFENQELEDDGGVVFNVSNGQFVRECEEVYPSFWLYSYPTDGAALQQAINYSIANDYPVIAFEKMYDVTGHGSIYINKPRYDQRRDMFFTGKGGGIVKKDAGILFTAALENVSEFIFSGMRFHSTEGAGTVLFDYNKLINVCSYESEYKDVDHIVLSDTRYAQGLFFKDNRVFGGAGYAFSVTTCYAFFFSGNVIEERSGGFFENTAISSSYNSGLVVTGNLIEGLDDIPMLINGGTSINIKDNYFEENARGVSNPIAQHIVFRSNGYGCSLHGNLLYAGAGTRGKGTPSIRFDHLGGMIDSRMNTVQTGEILYSFKGQNTVSQHYDYGGIVYDEKIYLSKTTNEESARKVEGDSVVVRTQGAIQSVSKSFSGQVDASKHTDFEFSLERPIGEETLVSTRVYHVTSTGTVIDDAASGLLVSYSIVGGTRVRLRVTNNNTAARVCRVTFNAIHVGSYPD